MSSSLPASLQAKWMNFKLMTPSLCSALPVSPCSKFAMYFLYILILPSLAQTWNLFFLVIMCVRSLPFFCLAPIRCYVGSSPSSYNLSPRGKSILTWENLMCQRLAEHQVFASAMNTESPLSVWVTSDFPFLLPAPLKLAVLMASYYLLGQQRQKHSEGLHSSPDWMLGWSASESRCWILTP